MCTSSEVRSSTVEGCIGGLLRRSINFESFKVQRMAKFHIPIMPYGAS